MARAESIALRRAMANSQPRKFDASRSDYDVWFKDQCKRVFPPAIDFNEPVPPVKTLFDSERMPVALSS